MTIRLRYGTAVNVDCDEIIRMSRSMGTDFSNVEEKCISWFNSHYKDKHISDLIYNVDQVVPTESRDEWFDFYLDAQASGEKQDAISDEFGRVTSEIYNVVGGSPYEIWIEQCYENGINPCLSFRMNDTHAPELGYACQDFFYTAKENGWQIGFEAGWGTWNQWCYDYSVPEVRAFYTEYIDEILGKFDVYGIELDWQRNIHCFKSNSVNNCQYMDLFMEEINRIVAKYEELYGHEIKIMVRIARDIDDNMYFGFDVRSWAAKDWIDVIVPSSYWGSTASDMSINEWKSELADYEKVQVYAGFEIGTIENELLHTPESLAGFTSMDLQQGADKIYLYNLFGVGKSNYKICASLENAQKYYKRSYLVTWGNTYPAISDAQIYEPLPLRLTKGEESEPIVIDHGYLSMDKEAYLYIGFQTSDLEKLETSNIVVTYNGVDCEYKGRTPRSFVRGQPNYSMILSFRIPYAAWIPSTSGVITVKSDDGYVVHYIELMNGMPNIG